MISPEHIWQARLLLIKVSKEMKKMFSAELKKTIAEKIQQILQETYHHELPEGEINFLLHVDGKERWSWANIKNNKPVKQYDVPNSLIRNTSI